LDRSRPRKFLYAALPLVQAGEANQALSAEPKRFGNQCRSELGAATFNPLTGSFERAMLS
jgi:hypothetical protein